MKEFEQEQMKHLYKVERANINAIAKLNRLIGKIEDMKLDCDAEVYDALLDIFDTVNV